MGQHGEDAGKDKPAAGQHPLDEDKDTRNEQLKPFNEDAPAEDDDPALDTTKEAGQGTG